MRLLLVFGALIWKTSAHGQLTVPSPRKDPNGNEQSHLQVEPVFTINGPRAQYTANSMRCHDFAASTEKTTVTAGTNLPMTWIMEASHPGDCYVYISYDGAEPVNFFKIAQILGCGAADGLNPPATVTRNIPIPANLPPCDNCVLRWEWTSHQQVVNIEFYVNCADIRIQSNAGPTKPTPMTAISGIQHLPAAASAYRQAYNSQPAESMLVGPALATYTACAAGTPGCVGGTATGGTTVGGTGGTPVATIGGTIGGTPDGTTISGGTSGLVPCPAPPPGIGGSMTGTISGSQMTGGGMGQVAAATRGESLSMWMGLSCVSIAMLLAHSL